MTLPFKIGTLIAIGLVLLFVVLAIRSCGRSTPKLNTVEIQKAQQAIATEDRKQMQEILVQSDAREKAADATAVNANNATVDAINESKQRWSEASNDEMAAELERRAKESQ
jgi:hypothetical protein